MSETYYKAIHPDGTDWFTGTIRWLPKDGIIPEGGWPVEHQDPGQVGDRYAAWYLSVATVPTDCSGMGWPTRLLRVEPVGDVWTPSSWSLPNKRAAHAWRVMEELPAHEALGPQGPEVVALIETARGLTPDQLDAMDAARTAARGAARDAALDTALDTARDAAWGAAWDAAMGTVLDAVLAVLVRDLITPEHYDILTEPWRTVLGEEALRNE